MSKAQIVRHLVTLVMLLALLTLAMLDSKSGWGLLIAFLAYELGQISEEWRRWLRK